MAIRRRNHRVIVHGIPYFITCDTLPGRRPPPLPVLAPAVLDELSLIDCKWKSKLHGYVVMPDHWHALLTTSTPYNISWVMGSTKSDSARVVERRRPGTGTVWQPGFYDHVCRDERDFFAALDYIHWNPVEAKLAPAPEVAEWSSWYGYAEGGVPPVPIVALEGAFDSRWVEWRRHPGPRSNWPPWLR